MALGIPPQFRGGLNRIARLSDADLDALADALTGLPPFPTPADISRGVRSIITAEDEGDHERVTDALLNVAVQRRRWNAAELAGLVASATALDVPQERRDAFEGFLLRAVQAEALLGAARGLDVISDRENIATDTRILTDVRAVFDDQDNPQLRGAAVIHTLSLGYHTASGVQKLQVAVSETDLRRLQETIGRALKKSTKLRGVLNQADVQDFDYADEDDT
jgi:hypothetical protein